MGNESPKIMALVCIYYFSVLPTITLMFVSNIIPGMNYVIADSLSLFQHDCISKGQPTTRQNLCFSSTSRTSSLILQYFCIDKSQSVSYAMLKVYLGAICLVHIENGFPDSTHYFYSIEAFVINRAV